MMKKLKIFILLLSALTLGACSSIKSTSMLGDYALKLSEDEWNGTWVIEKDIYHIRVINPDFGIFELVSTEDGKSKKHRAFAAYSGDDKYINLVASDKKFFFAKFKKEKDSVTVWLPSKKMWAKAIEDNKIDGEVDEDGNILITAKSSRVFSDFFKTNKELKMFDYENSNILKRRIK